MWPIQIAPSLPACRLREVARDALLQVARLADVEHVAGGVEVAIDAGQVRQRRDLGEQPLARRAAIASRGGLGSPGIDGSLRRSSPHDCAARPVATPRASIIAAMRWDLFCRVVDNFGDVGVAWRLAADLAGARRAGPPRRSTMPSALAWMAPRGARRRRGRRAGATAPSAAPDVVVELFGGGLPAAARRGAAIAAPGLSSTSSISAPSPTSSARTACPRRAAAAGRPLTTWFFYPGFTPRTGGLLREPGLLERRRGFDARGLARVHGIERARRRALRQPLLLRQRRRRPRCCDALAARPTLLLAHARAAGDAGRRRCLGPAPRARRAARGCACRR